MRQDDHVNDLTGANQYVGNWPGVTVEKKEGRYRADKGVVVTDLPGVYSLSPYTPEEIVTRDYLMSGKPDAVINLVDATNLERNLSPHHPDHRSGHPHRRGPQHDGSRGEKRR